MKRKTKGKIFSAAIGLVAAVLLPSAAADAAGSYISYTPLDKYWTVAESLPYTDLYYRYSASNRPEYWYDNGTTINTGIQSTLRSLEVGEHYYSFDRTGEVPVGKWVVSQWNGRCIHSSADGRKEFHGLEVNPEKCANAYYSGWFAYCADCGEQMTPSLVYMSYNAASSITSLDMDYGYFYLCPTCRHLENTSSAEPVATCQGHIHHFSSLFCCKQGVVCPVVVA